MGGEASKPGDYEEPELPAGVLEVRLSIYKLKLTGLGPLDEIAASAIGTYHSAVVVAGEEWSFGGHDQEGTSGVYATQPELNTEYTFYQRLVMGQVKKTKDAVHAELLNLAGHPRWAGPRYDLTQHNCNHFASDACWLLLKKRPPDWINATADGIAQQNRINAALEELSTGALDCYKVTIGEQDEGREVPGETAFKGTFKTTFNMAWERGWKKQKKDLADCPEGVDPDELKLAMEKSILDFAGSAGTSAAWAVAAGARKARTSRQELVASGRPGVAAWDEAWKKASAPLVAQWREQALEGVLRVQFGVEMDAGGWDEAAATAERQRMKQVDEALKAAAAAAAKAAVDANSTGYATTPADPTSEVI